MTNEKNNDNYEVPKLNIKQVLKESIGIYKSSFKAFIMLSVIIFILSVGMEIIEYKNKPSILNTYAYLIYSIIMLVYPFVSIYINSRLSMAMYILSNKLNKEGKISAKEAYAETSGLFWRYTGVCIQYMFFLVLPVVAIYVAYRYIECSMLKYAVIALLLIPLIYLAVKYYFVIISATLKKEENQYFKSSKLLVVGDFWAILFLIIISNLIFELPYNIYTRVLVDFKNMIALNKFIITLINEFLFIFITPFSHIVTTVMYLTLRRNKNID